MTGIEPVAGTKTELMTCYSPYGTYHAVRVTEWPGIGLWEARMMTNKGLAIRDGKTKEDAVNRLLKEVLP